MSDATKNALEEAIRTHVADEADGDSLVLTDWYLITASVCVEAGQTHYLHVNSDTAWHALLGLVHRAWSRMASYREVEDDE